MLETNKPIFRLEAVGLFYRGFQIYEEFYCKDLEKTYYKLSGKYFVVGS